MVRRRPFGFPGFDDDFFEEFDKIEEMMRQMLEGHFQNFEDAPINGLGDFKPKVYGFTLSFGPEGRKEFKEFGAPASVQKQASKLKSAGDQLVDVIDHPDSVNVVVEMPGVDEKHLQLKAFPKQLSIRVNDPERMFFKTLSLPAEVAWESMRHSLKNGILEVVLKKKK